MLDRHGRPPVEQGAHPSLTTSRVLVGNMRNGMEPVAYDLPATYIGAEPRHPNYCCKAVAVAFAVEGSSAEA